MIDRGVTVTYQSLQKLAQYTGFEPNRKLTVDREEIFKDWHNKEYLRVCLGNLYEKHVFGVGKSRITDEEWQRLCEGYKTITGEEYKL
jgi:hypothetical protein